MLGPEIHIRPLDLSTGDTVNTLLEVQRASYSVEAALIGFDQIPGLHDDADKLRASGESFLGAYVDDELAGAVSYKTIEGTIDIHRLVVRPKYFRKGLASRLLDAAEEVDDQARRVTVSTGSDNAPACTLYSKRGYKTVGQHEPVPGLRVTRFEKAIG